MDLLRAVVTGGYPEPVWDPEVDPALWVPSYVRTYVERDVRTLRAVGDLAVFERFVRLLAARSTGLLNASELARDLGVLPAHGPGLAVRAGGRMSGLAPARVGGSSALPRPPSGSCGRRKGQEGRSAAVPGRGPE